MPDDSRLITALAAVRERGAIGEASLPDAVARADSFVRRIPATARSLVDLGSGGGLPGLVIACRLPHLAVTLVERRHARADLLRRAVLALDLSAIVRSDDVRVLADEVPHTFDVVTARSFGRPSVTARWGAVLLVPNGVLLVSEPPVDDADRWPGELLAKYRLVDLGADQGIRGFRLKPGTAPDVPRGTSEGLRAHDSADD